MDDHPQDNLARNRARPGAADVFDILREDIISLQLPPGAPLQRSELQVRFGLSSTPVRDALMRLADEGLIIIYPQHATVVSRIDLDAAEQAQFLRKSIEVEIVRKLALEPTRAPIRELRDLIALKVTFADSRADQAFMQADAMFHRMLFQAAGVVDLWHLVRRRSGHIDRLRRLNLPVEGKMREIIGFHSMIVDAVAAGDGVAAQDAMREHLSRSLKFAADLKARHPAFFAP